MDVPEPTRAKFSIFSIVAIVAAILSFITGAFWGFILAMLAIVCGFIGVLLSFSARIRGGIVSAFSLFAGLAGIVAAVIKTLAWLF